MPSLARAQGAPGATIRVGSSVPAATIDPVTIADAGGLLILQQVAEFLCVDGPDLVLKPALAESWKPNDNGTVWTFKLRKGVKFHSGGEMKADDVVASIDRLADPANSSNALSVFTGILQKGATKKVDDYTVEFHLDAPNGNFPYMLPQTENLSDGSSRNEDGPCVQFFLYPSLVQSPFVVCMHSQRVTLLQPLIGPGNLWA